MLPDQRRTTKGLVLSITLGFVVLLLLLLWVLRAGGSVWG
jgi:hypothetical protein